MSENQMEVRPAQQPQSMARAKENMVDSVMARVEEMQNAGQLQFPGNYSVGNALQSAWLKIQETKDINGRPALDVCTKASVANALLNTAIQGLSPAKNQVYFIVYGNQLQAQRSYFGTMAATKRLPGVKDIWADVVYEGDTFKAHKVRGNWVIDEHDSSPENINPEKITHAYCIIETETGDHVEIMNKSQIDRSWTRSRNSKQTVHKEFPDQMAKRTVINRACKMFVNSSDDADVITAAFAETGDYYDNADYVEEKPVVDSRMDALNKALTDGSDSQ